MTYSVSTDSKYATLALRVYDNLLLESLKDRLMPPNATS